MADPKNKEKMRRPDDAKKTIGRILSYLGNYKYLLILVAFCIIVSALANVAGTYFLKPIINNYIVPLIGQENPDLSGFISTLLLMGAIYLVGVIAAYTYNRIMMNITAGTLNVINVESSGRAKSIIFMESLMSSPPCCICGD